ncbi:hypothetical protein HDU78_001588 [Chytriomyces hyalinus]|nr:hypothetical protein HDU78_001588 [Chytriomyces hyalinus]
MASKRLQKELGELTNTPSDDFATGPVSDSDLLNWEAKLVGPVKFVTKIYHPNVDEDGSICIGVLKPDVWKPSNKIADILNSLVLVLAEPNADDAINTSVAEAMNTNRAQYEKTCQEWINKYASV